MRQEENNIYEMYIKVNPQKNIKSGSPLYYNTAAKRQVYLKTTKKTKKDVLIGWALSDKDIDNYIKIRLYYKEDLEYCQEKGINQDKFVNGV